MVFPRLFYVQVKTYNRLEVERANDYPAINNRFDAYQAGLSATINLKMRQT